jgi:glycerate dehydrogenase
MALAAKELAGSRLPNGWRRRCSVATEGPARWRLEKGDMASNGTLAVLLGEAPSGGDPIPAPCRGPRVVVPEAERRVLNGRLPFDRGSGYSRTFSAMPQPIITVLDGFTLNPGDLSWRDLAALGNLTVHERTLPEQVLERCRDSDVVLTNKTTLPGEIIRALPALRFIGVLATGYNVVDVAAAAERGIPVSNVPGYAASSAAQAVFSLLLELATRTGDHARAVAEGRWTRSQDFCFWDSPLVELDGLTLGIVGFGNIGRAVARIARAFGMRVLVCSRRPVDGEENVSLDALFARSDVVSLHCPLTEETRHLVNADRLRLMRPQAFLINTGRGPLVDEQALAEALERGQIAGAGLDVLSSEPPPAGHPLVGAKNCLITPHIAWATKAARMRLMGAAVENVRAFLGGHPQNLVGPR